MVIQVLETNLDGWWRVRYQGKEGWAPAACLTQLKTMDLTPSSLDAAVEVSFSFIETDGGLRVRFGVWISIVWEYMMWMRQVEY